MLCKVCERELTSPWVFEVTLGTIHARCVEVGMQLEGDSGSSHRVCDLRGNALLTEANDDWPDTFERS